MATGAVSVGVLADGFGGALAGGVVADGFPGLCCNVWEGPQVASSVGGVDTRGRKLQVAGFLASTSFIIRSA